MCGQGDHPPYDTPLTAESEALLNEIYWDFAGLGGRLIRTSRFDKEELTNRLAAIEAAAAERATAPLAVAKERSVSDTLRDALATALIAELGHGPNRKNATQLAAAIYDHPAVAEWRSKNAKRIVALIDELHAAGVDGAVSLARHAAAEGGGE